MMRIENSSDHPNHGGSAYGDKYPHALTRGRFGGWVLRWWRCDPGPRRAHNLADLGGRFGNPRNHAGGYVTLDRGGIGDRHSGRRSRDRFCDHRCDEAIAMQSQSFDINRLVGVIGQDCPNLLDALVDPALKVDIGLVAPQMLLNLFASDDLPGAAGQESEQLERLRRQAQDRSGFPELLGTEVQLEDAKAK